MLAMILSGVQAFAGPSYTSSMSFSQGFDLETGVVDQGIQKLLDEGTDSPNVIRLVFVVQDIEPQQVMYSFDPEIDLWSTTGFLVRCKTGRYSDKLLLCR